MVGKNQKSDYLQLCRGEGKGALIYFEVFVYFHGINTTTMPNFTFNLHTPCVLIESGNLLRLSLTLCLLAVSFSLPVHKPSLLLNVY